MMDAVTDPRNREVWVMKSAQVGWTEILGNVIGYHMHLDPCPILMIQPTVEMGQAWSKDRFDPMLRDTPPLRGRVKEVRGRGADRGNTVLHKKFPGGHITIAGANSPAGLASRPIRLVLFDEVDRFPSSAGDEGDPITLAKKRATAFWNRRILGGSTPTTGASRIAKAFESGDQRRFFVPCPHCAEFDYLQWDNVTWQNDDPETARLVCPHCGSLITDHERIEMMREGEWRATAEFTGTASFHVWEAYNTMVTLADLVRNHLDQAKLPETHRTWVNTSLGLPYEERGEAPEEDRVRGLREGYRQGEIAEGVKRIVAGVDVQANRLVYVIRGFGMNLESWLVRHGELWGDTSQPFVWDQLQQLLDSNLGTEENERRISLMAIDSGYRPDEVYRFCRKNPRRAVPTKGHDTQTKPLRASKVDVTIQGRLYPAGMQIWHLDSDYFKSWVHGRLEWEGESGRFRLPTDADDDYCKQLVAETRIVDERGRATWKKLRRDNHYLDCEALNSAAAHILQLHLLRPKAKESTEEAPKKQPRVSKGTWTSQW